MTSGPRIAALLLVLLMTAAPLAAAEENAGSSPDYVVLVDKQSQTLFLFAVNDGEFTEVFHTPCSTGEVKGAKDRSGDRKTPEGVYFFIAEHPDRDLAPIYGTRAFPIDYPNLLDRLAGRSGNAIWLHGTNKPLAPRDSNGCIVVENGVIDRLAGYITLHRTPIIIVDKIQETSISGKSPDREEVDGILARWEKALTEGSYHDYLGVYDPGFLPDLSWWQDWSRLRGTLQKDGIAYSVALSRTSVYRHGKLYTVLFDQAVRTPFQEVFIGTRKLYMTPGSDGLRIVGDEDQVLAEAFKANPQGHALVAACRTLKKADIEKEIASLVDGWLKAWSSRDIDRYASYYSKDFQSEGGADYTSWIRYKDRLNRKYRFIRVSRKNGLTIERGSRQSTVSFIQSYSSNAFDTTGVKKLILQREGNQWKIVREIFNQT